MKQIVQNLQNGLTEVVEAPAPAATAGTVLISTRASLISAGTERMLVGFGRASLLQKARQQPERVRDVLNKVRTDGALTTFEAVRSKLGQPIPLGYSNVGQVIEVGAGVTEFAVGDRVASNGPHADIVRVPRLLCAKVPDEVNDETAAFAVVASIGLQGIRLAAPTLGEAVVVTGAGLVGLLTIQLLLAQGCRVMAIDFDSAKLAVARDLGAEICNPANGQDPVAAGMTFSRGAGVDAVLITASTESSDPVTQAAKMSRKRGRIVLVGVTGLELNRADFYEKELSFQVSCSYGPGRYDPAYEAQGQDYPLPFVRWTEQRNLAAVLDVMAAGRLQTSGLISRRYAFENAGDAYDELTRDKSALGLLLTYDAPLEERTVRTVNVAGRSAARPVKGTRVGFIGSGNYASRVLIPAFKAAGAQLETVVSSGGLTAALQGRAAGFAEASTENEAALSNNDLDVVVIATRHDSHAELAAKALTAGKHVFVEKPLALTLDQLAKVEGAYAANSRSQTSPQIMVGFNRRFAPLIGSMKALLDTVEAPKAFIAVMNAGAIPATHWTQDPAVGGGRIIGEACHYVDLLRFLAASPIVRASARRMGDVPGQDMAEDKAVLTLEFADGSLGTIHYLANGASSFPKERVEVFVAGRTLQLDNFRALRSFGWPGAKSSRQWRQDKGQKACAAAFLEGLEAGRPAIPPEELFEVARVTIELADQLRYQ